MEQIRDSEILEDLAECRICPHRCEAKRLDGQTGYCNSGRSYQVSSVGLHFGEEPVLSGADGICNVFFSRCNLSCVFCQNHQISARRNCALEEMLTLDKVVGRIEQELDKGTDLLGFVSPSHFIPQTKAIIRALHEKGRHPRIIYNTNGYDTVDSLKSLENTVDVYLPDFKYMDKALAKEYSGVGDYPQFAGAAIKEMYSQKGSRLWLDEKGKAESGLIIRHLVLPGHVENSLKVLDFIANELSVSVHISLMSQYNPTPKVAGHPKLGRKLQVEEYQQVVDHFYELGFSKGWVQELESSDRYNPDFEKEKPFGDR
ncbi:MAG: hypothetical protein K9H64_17085 [Bacteroidales bacterium]|nr:hypothetical protein [Bacteroidales bacterium]MCF8457652.1 hypothetical protein [Bacteroidales bacterium]